MGTVVPVSFVTLIEGGLLVSSESAVNLSFSVSELQIVVMVVGVVESAALYLNLAWIIQECQVEKE